ncbi:peptidoglycan DD-metalloendopeptidase family protein [Streptomyces sp. NPDC045456]|uniref:peptidoglycan DD-metalloendopeptidase family protein n=1 Tax=Streptomyces sp. NPDC045456 TaxID=3155254 RepID=UPI0033FE003A
MRQRTVIETVGTAVTRQPARDVHAVPTTATRRPRVSPGAGHSPDPLASGSRRAAYARRTVPPAVRLLALCAAGTTSAVLAAVAAAPTGASPTAGASSTAGLAFAGAVQPGPKELARSSERRPAPAHPIDPDRSRPAPPATGERAWPVTGAAGARPTIARGWESPPAPWAPGHRGVDLLAAEDATVRAAAPGRVLFAGKVAGRGVLSIEVSGSGHPPLRTTYEPVHPTVRKGDHVTAGQAVAKLGPGPFHCSTPCLHWGLLRDKTYLDPLSLLPAAMLNPGPSRLLPVIGVPESSSEPGRRDPPRSRQSQRSRSPTQAAHANGTRQRPLLVLQQRRSPSPTPHTTHYLVQGRIDRPISL